MKRLIWIWLGLVVILFWEIFLKGFVAVPADTLVGAYLPWRDYKWGYTVGVPVKNPPISDVFSQFFLWKHLLVDSLHQGAFPVWNKYSFSGNALLATFHSAVLSPTNSFLILLPRFWGWNLYIISATFISGLSMALYLRTRKFTILPVIGGSVVFALAGPMTTWSEFGTTVWSIAFFPLALLVIDKYMTATKHLYLSALSCCVFWVSTAGNTQALIYFFGLTLAYLVFNYGSKKFIPICLSLALGLGLSAIQLLPTADFYRSSIRELERYSSTFNYGLSQPTEIIRLWAADFFGNPVTYNHWSQFSYHEYSNFLGTLGFTLVLSVLFFRRHSRWHLFFIFTFITSLVLAYAHPLSQWLFSRSVPLLTYSSASRLFFVTGFSGAILVAYGLQTLLINPAFRGKTVKIAALVFFLTLVYLVFVPPDYRVISLRNSLLPLGLLGLTLIAGRAIGSAKILVLLIVSLQIFDLSRYFRKYNPFVPNHLVFPSTPIIDYLRNHTAGFRLLPDTDEVLPPNTWTYYQLESPIGYDPLYSLAYNRFLNLVDHRDYFARPSRYATLKDVRPEFLDLLSVKYLVSKIRPDDYLTPLKSGLISAGWQEVYSDKSTQIHTNPHVLPKAVSITRFHNILTEPELAEVLASPDFSPTTEVALFPPVSAAPTFLVPAKINQITDRTNGLDVRYLATDSALILISQSYDPAWIASVNRIKIPVHRADGGLLAVFVPPGANLRLQLRYFPRFLLLGAGVSAICGLLVLVRSKITV